MKQIVDERAAKLAEHFDSVQVFVTLHDGGNEQSHGYETGRGNFYTRYGQVSEWLSMQEQYQRNEAKRRDKESD